MIAVEKKAPAYLFEPGFIREQLAEAREARLLEDEDFDMRGPVGTGEDWEPES